MIYKWDEAKRIANMVKHGQDFEAARRFDWAIALQWPDIRKDYGETRWLAYGKIDGRLHLLVFTGRNNQTRVISLRKANAKEQATYGNQIDPQLT